MSTLEIPTARVFVPLLESRRYKGAKGGRGSGKSHFFADLAIERSYAEKIDICCLREVQLTLDQSVKKLIESKIRSYGLESYFDIRKTEIRNARGGVMIFVGMQEYTADNIKSLEGFDVAWFEEAHRAARRSLTMLRPTIRKPGSELWFSWNPEEEDDPVDGLFQDLLAETPEDCTLVEANYWDNPWFPVELRKEMELDRKRDPDKYQHVWCGGYNKRSEALVFKNWKVEDFETPRGVTFRLGADWGYANDPSVLVRCYIDGRTLFVDREAYMVGCEVAQLPDLFRTIPDAEKWFITADSSRPETISHMQKNGFPKISRATKGAGSVEDGIEFLKSFDLIVHPSCVHTIAELKSYKWKIDKLTERVLPILEDKNNHVIDALRYACEGVRRAQKPKADKREVRRTVHSAASWMGA